MDENQKIPKKSGRGGLRNPPGGRPPGVPNKVGRELREAASEHTEAALAVLVALMNDPCQPGSVRVSAAAQVLDRGHGRPSQSIEAKVEQTERFVMALPPVAESEEEWLKQLR